MSKGSNRRPTDEKAYGENFDSIFRNVKQEWNAPWDFPEDGEAHVGNICQRCSHAFKGDPHRKVCALCHHHVQGED